MPGVFIEGQFVKSRASEFVVSARKQLAYDGTYWVYSMENPMENPLKVDDDWGYPLVKRLTLEKSQFFMNQRTKWTFSIANC